MCSNMLRMEGSLRTIMACIDCYSAGFRARACCTHSAGVLHGASESWDGATVICGALVCHCSGGRT